MIKYLFLQAGLTFIIFTFWLGKTSLPGGEVGMAPFLLGIFLLTHFTIGILISLVFRKYLITRKTLLIAMLVYLGIYEIGPLLVGSKPMILGIFEKGSNGETNRAFALIPLLAGLLTLIVIGIRERKRAV